MVKKKEDLPIVSYREEILKAIRDNQVVIVVGETGSGKTTMIPQFLYAAGFGKRGWIGITQPRRIAAVSVARYVAKQMGCRLGSTVGYKIRFDDEVGEETVIKFMTDGILLREMQSDPELSGYAVIMVDEAHERSLNIDFALGLLKDLLKRRPDLKVLITSATIDAQKFSKFFDDVPIINVSGRSYPVSVQYTDESVESLVVEKIHKRGRKKGDILVFVDGWESIQRTIHNIKILAEKEGIRDQLVFLPCHSEMEPEEQQRIFQEFPGETKVIVATNIAETSITPDGVVYVVDTGWIKQMEFDPKTGISALKKVKHSKTGCDQRAGRAGRTQSGVCFRLYSKEDYEARPEFSTPEILRASLTSVVLQMKALGIKNPEEFEFVDRPDPVLIRRAHQTLRALGALDDSDELTETGQKMAEMPLEPRIGRMIIEAEKRGCLEELMIIAAGLSVRNVFPRITDEEKQKLAANAWNKKFRDGESDFLTLLNVWREYEKSGFSRQWLIQNFLNWRAVEEIRKIRRQLFAILRNRYKISSSDNRDEIAKSVMAGLLENILKYHGWHFYTLVSPNANDIARIYIHPSSATFGVGHPDWLVCSEILQTSKNFARQCAAIQPEWLEEVAPHLCEREITSIQYNSAEDRVVGVLRVKFGDQEIVTREVEVTDERATEAFIDALMNQQVSVEFVKRNREVREQSRRLRIRSGGAVEEISEDSERKLYEAELSGKGIFSLQSLKSAIKSGKINPDNLLLKLEEFISEERQKKIMAGNPDTVEVRQTLINIIYEEDSCYTEVTEKFARDAESEGKIVLPSGRTVEIRCGNYSAESFSELVEQLERKRIEECWKKKRSELESSSWISDPEEVFLHLSRLLTAVEITRTDNGQGESIFGFLSLKDSDLGFKVKIRESEEEAREETKIALGRLLRKAVTTSTEGTGEVSLASLFGGKEESSEVPEIVEKHLRKVVEIWLTEAQENLSPQNTKERIEEIKAKIGAVRTEMVEKYEKTRKTIEDAKARIEEKISDIEENKEKEFVESEIEKVRGIVKESVNCLNSANYEVAISHIWKAAEIAEGLSELARERAALKRQAEAVWQEIGEELYNLKYGYADYDSYTSEAEKERAEDFRDKIKDNLEEKNYEEVLRLAAEARKLLEEIQKRQKVIEELIDKEYSECPVCGGEMQEEDHWCNDYEKLLVFTEISGDIIRVSKINDEILAEMKVSYDDEYNEFVISTKVDEEVVKKISEGEGSEITTEDLWQEPTKEQIEIASQIFELERKLARIEEEQEREGRVEVNFRKSKDLRGNPQLEGTGIFTGTVENRKTEDGWSEYEDQPAVFVCRRHCPWLEEPPRAGERWICTIAFQIGTTKKKPVIVVNPQVRVDNKEEIQEKIEELKKDLLIYSTYSNNVEEMISKMNKAWRL